MAKNGQGMKNNEQNFEKVKEQLERILRSVNEILQRINQKRLTKCQFFLLFLGYFFPNYVLTCLFLLKNSILTC